MEKTHTRRATRTASPPVRLIVMPLMEIKLHHKICCFSAFAISQAVIYFAWLLLGTSECSGRHCLGLGPLIFIYSAFLLFYSLIFYFSTSKKITLSNNFNYFSLIKRPILITLTLITIWLPISYIWRNQNIFAAPPFQVWHVGVFLVASFLVVVLFFKSIWFVLISRYNQLRQRPPQASPAG